MKITITTSSGETLAVVKTVKSAVSAIESAGGCSIADDTDMKLLRAVVERGGIVTVKNCFDAVFYVDAA